MMDLLDAALLGLVEGVTEFIPVSSTGHLILAGHLLGFEGVKASTFEIFIQLGAILAVVVLQQKRILALCTVRKAVGFGGPHGLALLGLTTLPALLLGGVAHGFIKAHLFNPMTVALGLGVGGIGILLLERFLPMVRVTGLDALSWREALTVGVFQCLALWPGMSRSASTILGGMSVGIERRTAAEYSFLAAIPVMFAATVFDLYKSLSILHTPDIPFFGVGFIVSFLAAWLVVKGFLRLLGRYTLTLFGWYRLAAAGVILLLWHWA